MRLIYVDNEKGAIERFEEIAGKNKDITSINSFTDGKDALDFLKKNRSDIAFMGIELHGMDGILLAKKMKKISPELHVVFLTAYPTYALEAFSVGADGYLLKPYNERDLRKQIEKIQRKYHIHRQPKIYFQTMPRFELFVDGKLVPITKRKGKELLALLVDYAGNSVTTEEAINCLWEDRPIDENAKALLRMTAKRLREVLAQVGAESLLIEENGVKALNIRGVDSDYFQILDGNEEAMKRYRGEYMTEYSWAEYTNAKLAQITGNLSEEPA